MNIPDLSLTPWRAIILSERQGIWTLVDADDYPWLVKTTWNVWHGGAGKEWKSYAKRNTGADRATIRMHREIMIRHDPLDLEAMARHHVDHINGCGLDNRKINLRWATPRENCLNAIRRRDARPTIDAIVRRLMSDALAAARQLEEVPF